MSRPPGRRPPSRSRCAAGCRPRQRLRQDHPRFAPGDAARRRSHGAAPDRRQQGDRAGVRDAGVAPGAGGHRRGRAADPRRAWPASRSTSRRWAATSIQVRHVLPAHRQPVVDPRAVGHARGGGRRGSLDFLAAAPIARRRIASRSCSATSSCSRSRWSSSFFCIVIAGSAVAALRATRSASPPPPPTRLAGAARARRGRACVRHRAVLRPGAAIGIAGAVMFAGFILNGYRRPSPPSRRSPT